MLPYINNFPPYAQFTQFTPAIPSFYLDVPSVEQRFLELVRAFFKEVCYTDALAQAVNGNGDAIKELQIQFQRFIDGEFDDYYKKVIYDWIQDNFADLLKAGIRQVFFGLTDDGYFCAYIPESWSEITFDTGVVFGRSDYGRLILRFEPDPSAATGVIDNTYNIRSYSLNNVQPRLRNEIEQLIADVETGENRIDYCYNTLFTNLSEVVSDGNF